MQPVNERILSSAVDVTETEQDSDLRTSSSSSGGSLLYSLVTFDSDILHILHIHMHLSITMGKLFVLNIQYRLKIF